MTITTKETTSEQTSLLKKNVAIQLRHLPGKLVKLDPQVYSGPTEDYAGLGLVFGWMKYHDYTIPFAVKIDGDYVDYRKPDETHIGLELKSFLCWSLQTSAEKAFWQGVTQDYSDDLAQSVQKFLGKDSRQIKAEGKKEQTIAKLKVLNKIPDLKVIQAAIDLETADILHMPDVKVPKVLFSEQEIAQIIKQANLLEPYPEVDQKTNSAKMLLETISAFMTEYQDRYKFDSVVISLESLRNTIADTGIDWYEQWFNATSDRISGVYNFVIGLSVDNDLMLGIRNKYSLENEIEQIIKLPNTLVQTYVQLADYVGQMQFKHIKITA